MLESAKRRWRAYFSHHVIADTDDALILHEARLPPVVYFPRTDAGMEYMGRTERSTHCPYKGDASYYTLTMDGQIAENVAWSYEHPLDAVSQIKGHIAFYTDRVEIYEVDDAVVNPHRGRAAIEPEKVDEVVLHTDAGDGASQEERWRPNVEVPDAEEGGMR
jgi:uncharacterized protein (DUF427 family)